MALLREFCAENVERVPAAIAAGAGRIELCDNLAVGGTTPSYGVIKAAVALGAAHGVPIMTMIRPRGGDFAYSQDELAIMRDDIQMASNAGSYGVVFGCERRGHFDVEMTESLLHVVRRCATERGNRLHVTFHMAFDAIAQDEQLGCIDWLAGRGVDRILTHGGAAGTAIEANLGRLQELVDYAAGRIVILPGAGITWQNCDSIASQLGVGEVHGTKIVRI